MPIKQVGCEQLAHQQDNCQIPIVSDYFKSSPCQCHQATPPRNTLPWSRHRICKKFSFFPELLHGYCVSTSLWHFNEFPWSSLNHRISQVGRDPQGSFSATPCSSQDSLHLNHMTKSIVQMLLELWQAWCHDHLAGEPVPVTWPPSQWRTFS